MRTPVLLLLAFSLAGCARLAPAPELIPPTSTPSPATPTAVPTATFTASRLPETPTPMSASEQQALNAVLLRAAEAGDTAALLSFLQAGAQIDTQDERGRTPIMAATHANQVEAVRLLIQSGADIDLRDHRLDNPFLYASAEGLYEIVRLAIEAGADTRLTNRFGGTALIPASERGHVAIVRELLTRTDVAVNHVNDLGWTALLEAVILSDGGPRHQQIVQLLVDHGADVDIPDKNGITALEHARARGFREIKQVLLAAGAR